MHPCPGQPALMSSAAVDSHDRLRPTSNSRPDILEWLLADTPPTPRSSPRRKIRYCPLPASSVSDFLLRVMVFSAASASMLCPFFSHQLGTLEASQPADISTTDYYRTKSNRKCACRHAQPRHSTSGEGDVAASHSLWRSLGDARWAHHGRNLPN